MPLSKVLTLLSAALGLAGTIVLYRGSFAFESFGAWQDEAMVAATSRRNARRQLAQRVGLGLLALSFVASGASALVN